MRIVRLIILLLLGAGLGACATPPGGRAWGEDATATPGWRQVREAASQAARSPRVWVPLLAAALLQVDDWDRDVADWAREETPLFGSNDAAAQWSDDLRTGSIVAFHVTALAAPGGATPRDWFANKLRGYAVDAAAIVSTTAVTQVLKAEAGRERPNGVDHESFPSGHTAVAAVHGRLASLNLRAFDLPERTRRVLDLGFDALVIGTSWARIEAGWHYPSDTLVSASLGAFFAGFYDDAFMGRERNATPRVYLDVDRKGASLQLGWRF